MPSPKVATYDLKPEMSAPEVTDKLVEAIGAGKFDLIVVNYANSDMVGHSGISPPPIKAVEAVDACLGRLMEAVRKAGGVLLVTADHGNAEHDVRRDHPPEAHTSTRSIACRRCCSTRPADIAFAGRRQAGRCRPHPAGL